MSVVNIVRSRSGRRSLVNALSGEEVTSGSTGLSLPKRPYTFPHDHDRPPSSIAPSSRKKPRFDMTTPDIRSNHLVVDLEEGNSPQEQSSSQLPDDFLEPLPPDRSCAADSPLICMPQSFPLGLGGCDRGLGQVPRQFWKAGDYLGTRSDHKFAAGGMDHVRVHPKFLHSNATSHKWVLGAVAELLDNAFDEMVNGATVVSMDMVKNPRNGEPMLLIEDDGGGMDPDSMRHCMSLGYSVKSKIANTIGQYGNGFKTSTMRLGADVIVFSRCSRKGRGSPTKSIGLLSYTFLTDTGQEDIIVPIVDYEIQPFGLRKLMRGSVGDWNKNVETITQWSPYSSEAELLDQFEGMPHQGTRVVVYNLWEDEQGLLELDFTCDDDIQVRGVNRDEKNIKMAEQYPNCRHYLTYRHSLRSYASILYLRLPSQFKIILRGKKVQHHSLSEDMMLTEEVTYKPQRRIEHTQKDAGEMKAVVTVGFIKDAKEHIDVQGFSVYHKNRLIKPFWRIWNTPDSRGRGIIGVLEANFVEPAHDKQGFERTIVLARLETRLIDMQKSYWSRNCHEVGYFNKSLKGDGRLIPRSESPAADGLGIENGDHALLAAQGFTSQDLEVQGGAPLAAVLTHSQVEFSTPTRQREPQIVPASMEITASKIRSESHCAGQVLQDLATTRSLPHMEDIPEQSCGSQVASLVGGGGAAQEAFLLKAMAAADVGSPKTDETSRPRTCRTTQTDVTKRLDSDTWRTVQEKHVVTVGADVHILQTILSPRSIACSITSNLEQVDLGSGGSSRNYQNVDAVIQESSSVVKRNTVPEEVPTTTTACDSNSTEVDAVTSLRSPLVSSKGLVVPNISIPESNGDSSQNLVSKVGVPERHSALAEKAVDVSSAFPKSIEITSPNNTGPMKPGSQAKHKPSENSCQEFAQRAAASTVRKNLEVQESPVNSSVNARQESEVPISASLEESGLPSACVHLASEELQSQFSCTEQEAQFLKKGIAEVVGEAEKLREQLQLERQLVEMEMEDLRKQLGRALSHLENLKTENIGMQALLHHGLKCEGPVV